METLNTWSARDRAREASNDYYQKDRNIPLNGYNMGDMGEVDFDGEQGTDMTGEMEPVGIKIEDSMDGYLANSNPAYKQEASE